MTTFVAIDFETANRSPDSACAVGLVRVQDNQIVQRASYLIRPPQKQFEFTAIHGISWRDVVAEKTFGERWPEISDMIQDADFLVAHNAAFDKRVLYACCAFYEIDGPPQTFLCTVKIARQHWSIYPTKLPNVCDYLGIELEHHQALSDAEACARIMIATET